MPRNSRNACSLFHRVLSRTPDTGHQARTPGTKRTLEDANPVSVQLFIRKIEGFYVNLRMEAARAIGLYVILRIKAPGGHYYYRESSHAGRLGAPWKMQTLFQLFIRKIEGHVNLRMEATRAIGCHVHVRTKRRRSKTRRSQTTRIETNL